jgi:hypothetical protein
VVGLRFVGDVRLRGLLCGGGPAGGVRLRLLRFLLASLGQVGLVRGGGLGLAGLRLGLLLLSLYPLSRRLGLSRLSLGLGSLL